MPWVGIAGSLDDLRPTPHGVAWPTGRVLSVLIDEQIHHGAEIALLRDLYRDRDSLTG